MDTDTPIIFQCTGPDVVVPESHRIAGLLSGDIRRQFLAVFASHLRQFDVQGTFERLNGLSLDKILLLKVEGNREVIASGEQDGVKFTLYGPEPETTDES